MAAAVRHAVVFEPAAATAAMVAAWKARMAVEWPEAIYLTHPPHCTLWAGALVQPDAAGKALAAAVSAVATFDARIEGPLAFEDDALAAGGTTCTFRIALDEALSRLQRVVADSIVPFRGVVSAADLPASMRHEPFLSSWLRHGFPFVGSHWLPHLTVGTVPPRAGREFVETFLASSESGVLAVTGVTVWRVEGDRHVPVQHCSLHVT